MKKMVKEDPHQTLKLDSLHRLNGARVPPRGETRFPLLDWERFGRLFDAPTLSVRPLAQLTLQPLPSTSYREGQRTRSLNFLINVVEPRHLGKKLALYPMLIVFRAT